MFLRAAGALLFFRVLRSVQTMLLRMLSGRERSRVSDNPARERNSFSAAMPKKQPANVSGHGSCKHEGGRKKED